ncbi:MAG: hypothetical protein IT581_22675 [Verrucomicrobiales bacterium]|nr:hypothetical protein [Verrucomicrobiales bacterium]
MMILVGGISFDVWADTHIFAGAQGTKQQDPLVFTVASQFDTNSGFKLPMVLRTNGLNAGFYRGDVLTFTALAATDLGTGQLPGRALLGSRLAVQVVGVSGPEGGVVGFWEGDGENPGNQVTFNVPVGTTNGTNSFLISENNGTPGSDPYGHIHGRAFTTTLPGLYAVGFQLIDVSTNGVDGGPLHAPSPVLWIYFQAGPTVDGLERTPLGIRVSYRSAPGVSNVLEASTDLGSSEWVRVAGPLRGNSAPQGLTDPDPGSGPRFYRLRLLNIPP